MIVGWILFRKPDLTMAANGVLAGLVVLLLTLLVGILGARE